jgi:hypothetical protein
MNISQIEKNIHSLFQSFNQQVFIYDLLLAYGIPKSTIARLQQGGLNLSKVEGELLWKKKLFFKVVGNEDLDSILNKIKTSSRISKPEPRFIIVTDFVTLLAVDQKTSKGLKIPISSLAKDFDFFLPLGGIEKTQHKSENPADVKAAEEMAKLFNEIKKNNSTNTEDEVHSLNVFLSRLLFCFFAEDTGIFNDKQFTNSIGSHTQEDGSDLDDYLEKLFCVLNSEVSNRLNLPNYLESFPYVNGGLFSNKLKPFVFTRKSRKSIIDIGGLNWSAINPDIFGSMIQAVINPEHRDGQGMHYTSVPNIMKLIGPLFLNDLYEELAVAKYEPKRLNKLLERIAKIRIFDPACGSGNFLIIAYKELRLLEIEILQQLRDLQKIANGFAPSQLELIPRAQLTLAASYQPSMFSRIELSQFYGIELDDFAHEIAILSLWLAQHQMNMKFKEVFGNTNPTLPLQSGGNIIHGNATRIDWEIVCPKKADDEIFILGNPPYLGSFLQDKEQKSDLAFVCKSFKSYKDLDYIACWFIKGASFIRDSKASLAFVTTNSICQGEQVSLLWPFIFSNKLEISFAYESFKWSNNAKGNAGVSCTIIGIRNPSNLKKKIFSNNTFRLVDNINAYLSTGSNVIISKRTKPLSVIPSMSYGSKIVDNGHLIFSPKDKALLTVEYPSANNLFKRLIGSAEFIKGIDRWCLHIDDSSLELAKSIRPISDRLELVKTFRQKSTEPSTQAMAVVPHKFYYSAHNGSNSIIIPRTSSERRHYIPIGFLNGDTIVSDAASVVLNAETYNFGIITSRMHMTWVRAVAGRLKTDYRYSSQLCYNTFPFPTISVIQKQELERFVYSILQERENHSEKTLAQLYDANKMPDGLRQAHHQLDLFVDRCYRSKPFDSDEERLDFLFKQYEKMIMEEKSAGTLFHGKKVKTLNKK